MALPAPGASTTFPILCGRERQRIDAPCSVAGRRSSEVVRAETPEAGVTSAAAAGGQSRLRGQTHDGVRRASRIPPEALVDRPGRRSPRRTRLPASRASRALWKPVSASSLLFLSLPGLLSDLNPPVPALPSCPHPPLPPQTPLPQSKRKALLLPSSEVEAPFQGSGSSSSAPFGLMA